MTLSRNSTPVEVEGRRLRCRFGWHRWTRIPVEVQVRAMKADPLARPPDWYAGRLDVSERCWDCGRLRHA